MFIHRFRRGGAINLVEKGWFEQPKYSTPSIKTILRCVGFCLHILPNRVAGAQHLFIAVPGGKP